jgi:hypothetical protein
MNSLSARLWIVLLAVAAVAQNSELRTTPAQRAVIEGIVLKDPGAEPVKKVVLELIAENQSEGGDYTAVTGPDGTFRIEGIIPGRYRLFAERTGYLEFDKQNSRSQGRVLTLTAGLELKDIRIRLQAAAIVRGRVTDEDGDPLANAQVSVLREKYSAGRSRWDHVGSERTNDLGEYRIARLPPGSYYVAVNPPPDFKSLIDASGSTESSNPSDSLAKPSMSYQTTYYPGTSNRGQAQPIQLHAGDEFPVDFSLSPAPALSIRGAVVDLPAQSTAVIMLQSRDSNIVLNGAEMHKDGSFVIRDVAPGAYTIGATVENTRVPMTARQSLQIYSNVEGLRLAPLPAAPVRGRLRLDGNGIARPFDPAQMYLTLLPVDDDDALAVFSSDGFSNLAHVGPDGNFEWKNVPPGTYVVAFTGQSDASGWFLKSVLAGGRNAEDGVNVSGTPVVLDLIAGANGCSVDGAVTDAKGEPVGSADVVLVPEARLRSRTNRFRKTTTDQRGHFTLRAIAPGDYSLFAWESVEGEAYYSADFLKNFEGQGIAVRLNEADHKSLQLQAIPTQDESQ